MHKASMYCCASTHAQCTMIKKEFRIVNVRCLVTPQLHARVLLKNFSFSSRRTWQENALGRSHVVSMYIAFYNLDYWESERYEAV